MKSSDEIKKGLECCAASYADCHRECPYKPDCDGSQILKDALALIQQFEEQCKHMNDLRDAAAGRALKMEERVQQLEAERDAAVNFLRSMGCDTCMYDDYDGSEPPCINCTAERDYWMWRGVQKEESPC